MSSYLRIEDPKIAYVDIFVHYCIDHVQDGTFYTGKQFMCFSGRDFMILVTGPQDYPLQLMAGERIHSLKSDYLDKKKSYNVPD